VNNLSLDVASTQNFLHRLSDTLRLDLMRIGRRRSLAKNQHAFRAGEPADCVCIVEYGYLKVFEPVVDGRDVLMFIRAPGELLGLRGALQRDGKGIRTYSAQACEDSSVLYLPADKFRSYLETCPQLALEVAETLSQRLNESCDKLSKFSLTQVASRIAYLILNVGQCYGTHIGNGVDLNVPFSQQEIADMVGAARQTVSGIINTFKLDGVISVSHKHIRIEDIEKLRKLAASTATLELDIGPATSLPGTSSPDDRRRTPR
jgi:CRP/FNR family transcriptional regulator, cyclic AMP receptor protein